MAISFTEVSGGCRESWTKDGFAAQRVLRCLWSERNTLALELMAFGGAVYPNWPGDNVRVVDVPDIRPAAESASNEPGLSGFKLYEYADLTVRYGTVFYEPYTPGAGQQESPGIIVDETLDLGSEFITIDPAPEEGGDYLAWDNGDTTYTQLENEEAPGKRILVSSYVITRSNVPTEPPDEAREYPGLINSATVSEVTTSYIYEVGTLLYAGCTPRTVDGPDGTKTWTITYRFLHRPNGWNKFWRKKTGTWETIKVVDGTTGAATDYNVYASVDLNEVFDRP